MSKNLKASSKLKSLFKDNWFLTSSKSLSLSIYSFKERAKWVSSFPFIGDPIKILVGEYLIGLDALNGLEALRGLANLLDGVEYLASINSISLLIGERPLIGDLLVSDSIK